jgi:hypothetical protein
MGQGLAWILGVADWVADFNDAVRYIKAPAPVVLPLLAVSALFAVLWVGPSAVHRSVWLFAWVSDLGPDTSTVTFDQ